MTFGEKLLNLRRARGWTQEELADKIDVTRQALSKWEANSALPDTKNVVAIAKLFGVTTDYLLFEDEGRELAANTDAPKSAAPRRGNTRVVLGVILLVLGFCGVLAISISSIFVGTITATVPGEEYTYLRGISALFYMYKDLEKLFTVCIILCVLGLLLLILPAIDRLLERINEKINTEEP